jgi:hypothetical protein
MKYIYPWAVYCEGPPSLIFQKGRRGGEPKNEAPLFQSTIDIHIQTLKNRKIKQNGVKTLQFRTEHRGSSPKRWINAEKYKNIDWVTNCHVGVISRSSWGHFRFDLTSILFYVFICYMQVIQSAMPHRNLHTLYTQKTSPHCISYPSATFRTSISPSSVPYSPDLAGLLSSPPRFQSHMSTQSGQKPSISFLSCCMKHPELSQWVSE